MASFEQTKAVLDHDPNEPRALTYNAVVGKRVEIREGELMRRFQSRVW